MPFQASSDWIIAILRKPSKLLRYISSFTFLIPLSYDYGIMQQVILHASYMQHKVQPANPRVPGYGGLGPNLQNYSSYNV